MGKGKIWIGLFILFISGVLVGMVGSRMYMRHQISQALSDKRPVFKNLYMKRLDHKLNLTEEQRKRLEKTTDQTAKKFHALRKTHRKQVDALFEQGIAEMKLHLTPEQAAKLDVIHEKMKKRRHRFRHPPHQGPGPHGPMGKGGHPPHAPPVPPPDCPRNDHPSGPAEQ